MLRPEALSPSCSRSPASSRAGSCSGSPRPAGHSAQMGMMRASFSPASVYEDTDHLEPVPAPAKPTVIPVYFKSPPGSSGCPAQPEIRELPRPMRPGELTGDAWANCYGSHVPADATGAHRRAPWLQTASKRYGAAGSSRGRRTAVSIRPARHVQFCGGVGSRRDHAMLAHQASLRVGPRLRAGSRKPSPLRRPACKADKTGHQSN